MRIALVGFEFPPDTAGGGISTYVAEAAGMMAARQHNVEVICGSPSRDGTERLPSGVLVHRIRVAAREEFPMHAGQLFAVRHASERFDVVEGPDLLAEARHVTQVVPDIPLVVRLHSGLQVLRAVGATLLSPVARLRIRVGAWRRGEQPYWSPRTPFHQVEVRHCNSADAVAAPSKAIATRVVRDWGTDPARISHVPNVFSPSEEYLSIPPGARDRIVSYIGRVDPLKGALTLADAIPMVAARVPDARFRLIGRIIAESPRPGMCLKEYLVQRMGPYASRVEFCGQVPRGQLPQLLGESALCVFPSLWESFPYVGLEALAAARAVIGTRDTGLEEILAYGEAGRIVERNAPRALANAIVELLEDPALCRQLGLAGRQRVTKEYSRDAIGPLQEEVYRRAIERRRVAGPRICGSE